MRIAAKPVLLTMGAAGLLYLAYKRHADGGGMDLAAAAPSPGTGPDPVITEESPTGEPPIGAAMSAADITEAQSMAWDVKSSIEMLGAAYDRVLLASFQRLLRLTVDGLYGGRTAGGLQWALGSVATAPMPLFKPYTPVKYVPLT